MPRAADALAVASNGLDGDLQAFTASEAFLASPLEYFATVKEAADIRVDVDEVKASCE